MELIDLKFKCMGIKASATLRFICGGVDYERKKLLNWCMALNGPQLGYCVWFCASCDRNITVPESQSPEDSLYCYQKCKIVVANKSSEPKGKIVNLF